jgi:hypothetical protein
VAGAAVQIVLLPFTLIALYTGSRPFIRYELWEKGVTASRLGREYKSIDYRECRHFRYRILRSNVEGMHVGSTVRVEFSDGKRAIRFNVSYNERSTTRLLTIGARTFESNDEMDLVKLIVGSAMANAWFSAPSADFMWTESVSLGPTGLTPLRGRFAKTEFDYNSIDRVETKDNSVRLWSHDNPKPIATLNTKAPNFWPGFQILHALCPALVPPAETADEPGIDAPAQAS